VTLVDHDLDRVGLCRLDASPLGGVSDLHLMGLNPQAKFVPIDEQTDDKIMHLN
jgi:hypothetical protein